MGGDVSGYPLSDLKRLVQEQVQKSSLTVHAVQEVQIAEQTPIGLNHPDRTPTFFPNKVAASIAKKFDSNHMGPDCLAQPRLLPLELRQEEDQTKDVSSKGPMRLSITN